MDMKELKKSLRGEALGRRDALSVEYRIEAAIGMADRAPDLGIEAGAVVSGFWPMRSEVDVRPLMMVLADHGCRLCLPAIIDRTTILFRELVRGAPMVDMGFGTMGPHQDAVLLDPDVMLIPLAAFDKRGHRIGYGAGYYDRAIAALHAAGRAPRLIGIAFDCQEVEQVPNEPHDVQLIEMLTENGLRRFETV